MLSTTAAIKESNFSSTTSKQIPSILPYGKHLKSDVAHKKTQEDVSYYILL